MSPRRVGELLDISQGTLRGWIDRAEIDSGARPRVTSEASAQLAALRKENAELRRANEILKTASAFFAQAELDRRLGLIGRAWSAPTRPDRWRVADFTDVWTLAGFYYTSFVTDVYSKTDPRVASHHVEDDTAGHLGGGTGPLHPTPSRRPLRRPRCGPSLRCREPRGSGQPQCTVRRAKNANTATVTPIIRTRHSLCRQVASRPAPRTTAVTATSTATPVSVPGNSR